jgi:hypothetical protein
MEIVEQWKDAWQGGESAELLHFLRFLYEPASYLHRSRMDEVFPERDLVRALAQTRRGWLRLNAMILKHFNLDRFSGSGPSLLPRQRLIFAKPSLLLRLARMAGALLCADAVQRVVLRKEREALVNTIGAEAYHFSLRRSLFFAPLLFPLPQKRFAAMSLPKRAAAAGKWCVTACLDGLSADATHRFLLKFPAKSGWHAAEKDGPLDAAWRLMERLYGRLEKIEP